MTEQPPFNTQQPKPRRSGSVSGYELTPADRQRAGKARSTAARAEKALQQSPRLARLADRLERLMDELEAGTITPGIAQAAAALSRALTTVLSVGELSERVGKLEQQRGIVNLNDATEPAAEAAA